MKSPFILLPILLILSDVWTDPGTKNPNTFVELDHTRIHSTALQQPDARRDQWYDRVCQSIAASEYEIRYDVHSGGWSSPNRAQNLRFDYDGTGFLARPRLGGPSWSVAMHLKSFGRTTMNATEHAIFEAEGHSARSQLEDVTITYENRPDGMRQNFFFDERPHGHGSIRLLLTVESALSFTIDPGASGITFSDQTGKPRFRYSGLHVTDAGGHQLAANMQREGRDLVISIEDDDAVYPLLVDPLSTTPDWFREGQQLNEYFGYRLAPAGDVNGDGYSDFMVAATHYDNDQANEGRVFAFYGGPDGPDTTADWVQEGNQDQVYYGSALAAAGDVNGDGYADVLVGSAYFDNGQHDEGMVMLYFGGSGGLSDTANWVAESDQDDALFAANVACAGDVNGDGYSDVIAGAPYYDYGGYVDEGRAMVYYGSPAGPSLTPDWIGDFHQSGCHYAGSVASAGDVNADGYSDVLVAATSATNPEVYEGLVFVYHGGPSGLSTTYSWLGQGDQAHAHYGTSVRAAGDVNGDGYADVIVGAPNYDNSSVDCGLVFVYHGSATGLSWTWNWVADPYQGSSYLGSDVASAGDVNGDGYADVIVSAPYYDNGQADEGAAFVFYGSANGLRYTPGSFQPDWMTEGNEVNAIYSYCVAPAGDVNGDGFSDVLIGGLFYDGSWNTYGRAFIYYGGTYGLASNPQWSQDANQAGALFGTSVASAGDVNGDGFGDVIVGAPQFDNGQTNEGRTFVFHGGPGGPSLFPDWTSDGDQPDAFFGHAVASAGDVNADGYVDIAVGAYAFDNGHTDEGVVFVFHGGPLGLSATADWTGEGDQSFAYFGHDLACAGDVNGDGYSDLIVGAPNADLGQNDEGSAYIFYGGSAGLAIQAGWIGKGGQLSAAFGSSVCTAGDVNADGYSDVVVGAPTFDHGQINEGRVFVFHGSMLGPGLVPDWTGEGNQVSALYGTCVSTAGDVDGDGYSDVLVGAPQSDNGQSDEGQALLYKGGPTGLSGSSVWTAESQQSGAYLGQCVAAAGDINGDGFSDVVIGVPYYDGGESNEGLSVLYCGSAAGLSAVPDWSMETNQPAAEYGNCVASAGDVNGDGYSDLIVGSSLYDNGETDEGGAFIYYGMGRSGLEIRPRQFRPDLVTPVAPLGRTYSHSQACASIFVRPFCGPGRVQVQFEVKPLGTPFDGSGLSTTPWTFTGTGQEIKQVFSGLNAGTSYKWRARIKYAMAQDAVQFASRWIYPAGNSGLGEADFRVTNIANEPEQHAYDLSLVQHSTPAQHRITASWTPGSGTNRLVVAGETPISAWPHDGTSYVADTTFGQGSEIGPGQFVLYTGSGNSFIMDGATNRHTYYFTVFEFNGSAGDENYLIAGGTSNSGSLTIVNHAPTIVQVLPDTIVEEDFGSVFYRDLRTVFQDDTLLTFSAMPLAIGVVPAIVNDSLSLTAYPDFAGTVPIRVTASDGELSSSDTFSVTVLGENDPPGASQFVAPANHSRFLTNRTSSAPVEFVWNMSIDPDGQILNYRVLCDTSSSFAWAWTAYEGPDTACTMENRQLDTLAAGFGTVPGDSVELVWRVLSIAGTDTIPSMTLLQVRIVREIVVGFDDPGVPSPARFALHPNFPNPFNASTTIRYDLARAAQVTIRIYNLLGQEVRTLIHRAETAGYKTAVWDGTDDAGRSVASGVYLYRLEAANFTQTRKLLLLK